MAFSPFPQPIPYELPQPLGELAPYPGEDEYHPSKKQKSALSFRRSEKREQQFIGKEDGEEYEENPEQEPAKPFENFPAEGNLGLRCRKLAAATARTNFGAPRIRMES